MVLCTVGEDGRAPPHLPGPSVSRRRKPTWRARRGPEPGEPDAVWVLSDVAADGTYVVTVQAGPDDAWVLDRPAAAAAYADAVLTAVAYAEYDAAVLAQLTSGMQKPLTLEVAG